MVISNKTYTSEEFEAIIAVEENIDRRLELIYGEIIEKMPTQLHAYIVAVLTSALWLYLRQNPIGYVLVEARYKLPSDNQNDRIPDLSFVHKDKGALLTRGAAPYMPDLAVEVQSPGQSDKLIADKAAYYLANGTKMVWLVYPEKRLMEVLTIKDRQLLTMNDVLEGDEVLPDFKLPVREIFPES